MKDFMNPREGPWVIFEVVVVSPTEAIRSRSRIDMPNVLYGMHETPLV